MRASQTLLDCPVKDEEGSPCGEPVLVSAWPGSPGTREDPPESAEIVVEEAHHCDHFEILKDLSDEHYEALLEQLGNKEGPEEPDYRDPDDQIDMED